MISDGSMVSRSRSVLQSPVSVSVSTVNKSNRSAFRADQAAYFTLVMCGDDYVDAAVALATSIECSGTVVKRRYCMVTYDVSRVAVDRLSKYWTVVNVDYLSRSNLPPLLTSRTNEIYGSWISRSFTKWIFIKQMQRERVRYGLFFDADTVVLQNFDALFEKVALDNSRFTIYVNMFPFFDSLASRRRAMSSYSGFGTVVRTREETTSPDEWRVPIDALSYSNYFDHVLNGESRRGIPVIRRSSSTVERRETTGVQSSPTIGRTNFLFHSSLVILALPSSTLEDDIAFRPIERFYETMLELLRRPDNPLFAQCRFVNGWDEQLLAQTIVESRPLIRLMHLRSLHNVVVGYWDTRRVAEQPYSITWYGSCKPWRDVQSCPRYADEYLFRYFFDQSRRMFPRPVVVVSTTDNDSRESLRPDIVSSCELF